MDICLTYQSSLSDFVNFKAFMTDYKSIILKMQRQFQHNCEEHPQNTMVRRLPYDKRFLGAKEKLQPRGRFLSQLKFNAKPHCFALYFFPSHTLNSKEPQGKVLLSLTVLSPASVTGNTENRTAIDCSFTIHFNRNESHRRCAKLQSSKTSFMCCLKLN